jgi:hypothetical protein
MVAAVFHPFALIVGYFEGKKFEAKIIKSLFIKKRTEEEMAKIENEKKTGNQEENGEKVKSEH